MPELFNSDLRRDLEKIKSYDEWRIKPDKLKGGDWLIDINDTTYWYANKSERDHDLGMFMLKLV